MKKRKNGNNTEKEVLMPRLPVEALRKMRKAHAHRPKKGGGYNRKAGKRISRIEMRNDHCSSFFITFSIRPRNTKITPLGRDDFLDFNFGKMLAMPAFFSVPSFIVILEYDNFFCPRLRKNLCFHRSSGNVRSSDCRVIVFRDQQDFIKNNRFVLCGV